MKKIYLLIWVVLISSFVFGKQDANTSFGKAYDLYLNNNFEEANTLFLTLVEEGYVSHALYYNLACSYFKIEDFANAMLWFERAKRLNPSDEDTDFNINVTKFKLTDRIEAVPEVFFIRWFKSFVNLMNERSWAYLSLLFFFFVFLFTSLFLITSSYKFRKYSFYLSFIFLLFFITSIFASFSQKSYQNRSDEAIVMTERIEVKSSPDEASSDLFIIHSGVKLKILDNIGEWVEVKIPNGDKGWIRKIHLQII
jgi:tetratricopeptide (TPR) repeat protein